MSMRTRCPRSGADPRELVDDEFPEITWEHSHVVVDGVAGSSRTASTGAPNEDIVREHSKRLGRHHHGGHLRNRRRCLSRRLPALAGFRLSSPEQPRIENMDARCLGEGKPTCDFLPALRIGLGNECERFPVKGGRVLLRPATLGIRGGHGEVIDGTRMVAGVTPVPGQSCPDFAELAADFLQEQRGFSMSVTPSSSRKEVVRDIADEDMVERVLLIALERGDCLPRDEPSPFELPRVRWSGLGDQPSSARGLRARRLCRTRRHPEPPHVRPPGARPGEPQ